MAFIPFSDNLLVDQSSKDALILVDPSESTTKELISSSEWAELEQKLGSPISNIILSHDREMTMLVTNIEHVMSSPSNLLLQKAFSPSLYMLYSL